MKEIAIRLTSTIRWRSGSGRALAVGGVPHEIVVGVRSAQYRASTDAPALFVYLDFWKDPAIETGPIDSRTHVRVAGDARAAAGHQA